MKAKRRVTLSGADFFSSARQNHAQFPISEKTNQVLVRSTYTARRE
jgi:hypothetical protein